MKGTITGEHGDGIARSNYIKNQYGSTNFQAFKDLKKLFDPDNILNPGKITTYNKKLNKLETIQANLSQRPKGSKALLIKKISQTRVTKNSAFCPSTLSRFCLF